MKRSRRLQPKIHALVHRTGFTHHDKLPAIELILQRAVEVIDSFQKPQYPVFNRIGRPNHEAYRTILSAAIFRAWRVGMGEKAKINKRLPGAAPNPFVVFATAVYRLLHISNVIDNLDHYRSLGNTLERNSWKSPPIIK